MNISGYSQNTYAYKSRGSAAAAYPAFYSAGAGAAAASDATARLAERIEQEQKQLAEKRRELLRNVNKSSRNKDGTWTAESANRPLWELTSQKTESEKEKAQKPVRYNYMELSMKIARAKNSISAGNAVLSAKRSVMQLKGKISAKEGDPDELQLALSHARRMELVARKKKHHLEQEELAKITQERDERMEKVEDLRSAAGNAVLMKGEERLTSAEDAVFKEREELYDEYSEEIRESGSDMQEELLGELNEMLSELGEEELKELEEALELMEEMEFLDPHMSEEELDKVKQKHRASENKALLKADMDYLKGMIKQLQAGKGTLPGTGTAGNAGGINPSAGFAAAAYASAPECTGAGVTAFEGAAVDIQA
ncbi:MAG: hypothetical protein IK115_05830 [Lachnospiraceae bacterium]|nr:hypothetical protein [Lachnospiraceae bacterium]